MNEYYEYWKNTSGNFLARQKGVDKYGFAIPNEEALNAILELKSDIVEIGAGLGYWAYLLQNRGVKITPYDDWSGHWFQDKKPWTNIIKAGCDILENTTLPLLCIWPLDYMSLLDQHYKGNTLIYVGEDCCDSYNEEIWEVNKVIKIPQWSYINDQMHFLRRK